MNNNNIDKNKLIDAAIKATGGKLNKDAVSKGDAAALMSSLPKAEQEKIQSALSNPEQVRKLLGSDAARAILDMLQNGGKKNG